MNTVKSNHSIDDIKKIKPLLSKAELMVRVNPWYENSWTEIDQVIEAGADIVMLPYWKTPTEVQLFLTAVKGRCKTSLLLETKEAVECVDQVLKMKGIDEIHIGLNDLHLSYGMSFMFIGNQSPGSKFYAQKARIGKKTAKNPSEFALFDNQIAA